MKIIKASDRYGRDITKNVQDRYATIPQSWVWVSCHQGIDHYISPTGCDYFVRN